ncbi:PTS transporter subunit EIIC [Bacillus licheniformis]|nr:PTS transporter subunit EIIC [Bacillus licheniformis]
MIGYQGTVIPILLSVYMMSKSKILERIVPSSLDLIVAPFITVMASGFAALFIMGPLSLMIAHFISDCLGFVYHLRGRAPDFIWRALRLTRLSGLHHSFM